MIKRELHRMLQALAEGWPGAVCAGDAGGIYHGGSMTNPKPDQAVDLLQHYFRLALPHPMSNDVYAEIESIVDLIIDAAVARSSSRPVFSVFPRSLGPVRGSASPRLFPFLPRCDKNPTWSFRFGSATARVSYVFGGVTKTVVLVANWRANWLKMQGLQKCLSTNGPEP